MRNIFLVVAMLIFIPFCFAQKTQVRTQMLVTTDWLAKNVSQANLVLIHVGRDQKEYDAGHLPNARFLLYNDIIQVRDGVLNELPSVEKLQQVFSKLGIAENSRVVLYSDLQGLLAARTYFTLDYLGFGDKTALLDGGMEKWKNEKRSISKDVPAFIPSNFQAHINPKVLVTREIVKDVSWLTTSSETSVAALLDARPAEAYDGSSANPSLPKNGHIPGAGNVYWMNTLQSKETPAYLPVADLRKMYESAGIRSDKKVVTYCWIGMMASHAYFTLKYLGYDVAMYDGSFTEWAKSDDVQVITGKNPK